MPELRWIGKDKVVQHHLDVPFKVLEKQYTFTDGKKYAVGTEKSELSAGTDENRIIHGDNLEALKALLPEYEGRVKCIYIDPPYNTGNENWVYNDNVDSPKIRKWLGQVVGKESEDLTRHDKWLCMMYPRLMLLQKLLADDGAIFISIDDNEQASLKLICDEIFGSGNFVGTLAWESKTKCQNTDTAKYQLQRKHEYIFVYKKQKTKYEFLLTNFGEREYSDKDEKGKYRIEQIGEMSATGMRGRDTMIFPILNVLPKTGNQWKFGQETINSFLERKDIISSNGKVFFKIRPDDEDDIFEPFWSIYFKAIGTGETAKKELSKIIDNNSFETVKPHELIESLLNHVVKSDSSSIILDSFAGSGTTAHAVLNLNKKDGGNRKFILVELEDYAESITAERVKRVISGYGDGKNKIEGTGGSFSFYELGERLLTEKALINENIATEKLREYIWWTETHTKLVPPNTADNEFYLGTNQNAAYWFFYEKAKLTTLDYSFLKTMKHKADAYIIYADVSVLPESFCAKHNITFKKIPRDIQKF